jgi:hypothetical protein
MSAEVASAEPNRRALRAAYAAEALSSRTMRLGNAMVASRVFAAAGFVLQAQARGLHNLAIGLLVELGLTEREVGCALRLLGVPANDLDPGEFLREAEAVEAAAGALTSLHPDGRFVWDALVAIHEVLLHVRDVVDTATELDAGDEP